MGNFTLRIIIGLTVFSTLFYSCKKEDNNPHQPNLPDLQSRISSSVSGFVSDENDLPVQGATVQVGTNTASTDEYGYFSFTDVQVVKNAALVTVTHSGYFKGMRTYIAEAGNPVIVRIKLLPKTSLGTIDAATGGSVTAADGLKVELPANSVVDGSGAAYTGAVIVSAKWLNPTADDFSQIMPGDLRALNTSGEMRTLLSYGMAAVELTGNGGQTLQIADGKKSTVSFPLPSTLQGPAPASIPLWHFDEVKGLWIEEGSAMKVGDKYIGEVSHFSFWNCDVPIDFIQFNLTVLDTDGEAVPYARVKLTTLSAPFTSATGITNASGYVSGAVPANTDLAMTVYSGYGCSTPLFSQNIPASATNISIGNIILPAPVMANVSGNLTNCNTLPVINGYVMMNVTGTLYRYPVDNTGAYNFNFPLCAATQMATFVGVDQSTNVQSVSLDHLLQPGLNTIAAIQACGQSTAEFFNFTISDLWPGGLSNSYSFSNVPGDTVYQMNGSGIDIYAEGADGYAHLVEGGFVGVPMPGSAGLVYLFSSTETNNLYGTPVNPQPESDSARITEYGPVGQFIAGSFNFLVGVQPGVHDFQISGSFRVRRRY